MDRNVPLVTIGFDGYDLESTLRGMAKTNSRNVVLCAIDGFTKHVIPEQMDREAWQKSRDLVAANNLTFYGLFGHCNLSDDADLPKLKKRMEYTHFMGGHYIDTNSGHKGTEKSFYRNLPEVIELAERLDLTVCLETHGDMVQSGKDAARLFRKIKSPRIRVSYDPANVYFYNQGRIKPAEDILPALEHTGMIHFKGVNHSADKRSWSFPLIKESARNAVFDYEAIFAALKKNDYRGRIAVELEGRFRHEEGKGFIIDPVWPEAEVVDKYNQEIEYLLKTITWY
jgi:sugar phosphate isomerase/epimerase